MAQRRKAPLLPRRGQDMTDPDQDPDLLITVVRDVSAALSRLRCRPLMKGDHRALGSALFPGADAYCATIVRGAGSRPDLFPHCAGEALRRKQARVAGWGLLRGVLAHWLQGVADSHLREQIELLALCEEQEDFLRRREGVDPPPLQRARWVQLCPALLVRARYRQKQSEARKRGWAALPGRDKAPTRRGSVGRKTPARNREDLFARDLMNGLLNRVRPGWARGDGNP